MEAGKTVVLRSGGPKMCVFSAYEGVAICHWFTGDTVKKETFNIAQLTEPMPDIEAMSDAELDRLINDTKLALVLDGVSVDGRTPDEIGELKAALKRCLERLS